MTLDWPDNNCKSCGKSLSDCDIAAPFQEECRRLYEALDRLRPGHNTPYVDEEHQGGNCVDVLMAALLRAHNAEAESRQLRDRPDGNHLMTEACRVYRIVVEVPAHVADLDGLATAVADAAHDWEPEQRDGWDVDVSAGVVPDSRVKKS